MKRGVLHAANIIHSWLTGEAIPFRAALITLTYAAGAPWSPNHVKELIAAYRKWCARRGIVFRYVWTLELTARGVPHYHIVFWLPRGITPPKPDKQGWWRHGMTNCKWARKPVGYIAKYASKGITSDHDVPFGAHLWGCGGLSRDGRRQLRWHLCPMWLKEFSTLDDDVRRLPPPPSSPWLTGWWRVGATAIRSPWDFLPERMVIRWRGFSCDDVAAVEDLWG